MLATTRISHTPRGLFLATLACVLSLSAGCASNPNDSTAKKGAMTGAAIGAGMGLLMGVLSGDADVAIAATAMGAAAGAMDLGYEGFKQDQENNRTSELANAIRQSGQAPSSPDPDIRAREELTRLLGTWNMTGWVQDEGQRRNVSAQVNGSIKMNYFIEMAWLDLKIEGLSGQVWGTTTMGYDGRNGYNLSTRFNTLSDALSADYGRWDSAQRAFTFDDGVNKTTFLFKTPDRFSVTTTSGGSTLESYTFTRSL